jgi:hypothetical protein
MAARRTTQPANVPDPTARPFASVERRSMAARPVIGPTFFRLLQTDG